MSVLKNFKIGVNETYNQLKYKLKVYFKNVNLAVFFVITLFSIGSWVDMNGMFVELPLMVHELPERWRLPSILTLVMQVAQGCSFSFILFKYLFPKKVNYVTANFFVLGIGMLSCLLLSFFWKSTAFIVNEERSIGLYALIFTLGFVDGTSSLTFLPYVGSLYSNEYVIPYYIGESLSAMVASILGIIQGIGKDLGCRYINETNEDSNITELTLEQIPLEPLFSVSIYYILMFLLLLTCFISFAVLHYARFSINERKIKKETDNYQFNSASVTPSNEMLTDPVDTSEISSKDDETKEKPMSKLSQYYLIQLVFWNTFFVYGVLPSIQSYATIPYGNLAFYLSIDMSYFSIPFVVLFSIFSYKLSITRITIEFLLALALSAYIIVISVLSPCPPMLEGNAGLSLIVIAYVLTMCWYMRIRCCIAAKVESCSKNSLLLVGCATTLGQLSGGLLMYILVDIFRLFEDAPICVDIIDFCSAR